MFYKFISFFVRSLLSLRYNVKVTGLELLTPERLSRKGGILFLPNHIAHMEPLILFLILWPRFKMRPLVVEFVYRNRMLKPMMKIVKALPIPDFETSVNQLKIRKGELAIEAIGKGLKEGSNFLLYPSGGLKRTPHEVLGGASGLHAILQEAPETNPVLIRTSGFWGSSFSRAIEGKSPDIGHVTIQSFKRILKALIFFMPRRKVLIEIEPAPADFPMSSSKLELNRYLESWYNRYPDGKGCRVKDEPLQLVSYSPFYKDLPVAFDFSKKKRISTGAIISTDIRSKIYAEIRRIVDNQEMEIREDMNLALDLGMDSLNIGEFLAFLSSKYELEELHPEDLDTVGSALELAEGAKAAGPARHTEITGGWPEEPNRPDPTRPFGKSLAEAFLNSCDRMGSYSACADDLIGVMSYKKLKRSALVLAQHFKTMKETHVAVLLPASVGGYLTIIALQLAGKVPVMLNWTLGPKYLEEMVKASGAKQVVSSWKFLDRLSHVDFGNLIDKLVLLEDVREGLTLRKKLRGLFISFRGVKGVLKALKLDKIDENSQAVILFTSGTEAIPKGVPLSHKNLISNLRSLLHCVQFKHTDVLYGILPPFHSFGFSVAGLCPIFAGIKVAFYPDPTDSFAVASGIQRWKVTLFCAAPIFLRGLLAAAKKDQLKTVRYYIVGAERTAPELIEKIDQLGTGARILEGYGITECSPVISMTRPNLPLKGVGQVLPDVEACMIHPETLELLEVGAEGELCVRGPNVFSGYLGNPRTPFIEIEGKQWYRTGDLARIDIDGTLILCGRLKRFAKLGGEMISLAAVEEAISSELLRQGKITLEAPSIAVCADERVPGKMQLILFSTVDLDRNGVNEILQKAGLSRLIKINSIHKMAEIPVMGAGKVDHRKLQSMLK